VETLVVLTTRSIEHVLGELPAPWKVAPGLSAGSTLGRAGLAGPVGAWLDFYGIVRDRETIPEPVHPDSGRAGQEETATPDRPILAIEYEAHPDMAQHQLEQLVERIGSKYPLRAMLVIHRIGRVPVGEASLLVRLLSGHRQESLHACAEFIDELKKWIPIWKHPISA
jgi:molybdopterin synthase catalytic subunit